MLFRWLFTLVYGVLFVSVFVLSAALIPLLSAASVLGKKTAKKLSRAVVRLWARFVVKTTLSPVGLVGGENIPKGAGNVVYIVNHQSYFDIPILLGWVDSRIRFVAREDLFSIPILGAWMRFLGCVPVSRRVSRSELRRFEDIACALSEGGVFAVFPEGTRTNDGELGRFHPSAFRPARRSGATIVPVLLWGSHRIMPKGRKTISPSRVFVVVGEPIEPAEYANTAPAKLAKTLRKTIEELKGRIPYDKAVV